MKKRLVLVCLILFNITFTSTSLGLTTISDLKEYAQKSIEYPQADNKDSFNPDYTSFHKKHLEVGFLKKAWFGFLRFFGFRKPFWSIKDFNSLLAELVKKRKEGLPILKFAPKPGSKFIVWGDIQGAFHSLVRCLDKLKELNIIDEDLKIIKPDHYFVFNGNLINRSPYILETLKLVLKLKQQNPGKVFYMRGEHENQEFWYNYGLKRELKVKTKPLSKDEKEQLNKNIHYFFNILPLALFLKVQQGEEFVCISHYGLESKRLKEKYFADFLKFGVTSEIQSFNLETAEESDSFVGIEAIIKGLDRTTSYISTQGVSQLIPDYGATAWTILSAPTTTYQKMYNFYYDSFAIVTVGSDIYKWTITAFSQDVKRMEGFVEKSFYLVSSQSTNLPASSGKITIGCSTDLKTEASSVRKEPLQGMFVRLNRENRGGGISGKYIKFVVLNDNYDPILAKKNIEKFLTRYKTDITLGSYGSPTLSGYLDLVKSGKILVLFPVTGAPDFRSPDIPNIVSYRASYLKEGEILDDYAIKKLKMKRFAVFYQDDVFGFGPLSGIKEIFSKYGIGDVVYVSYLSGTTDFKEEADKILEFDPEAVIFASGVSATEQFVRQLGIKNLVGKKLLGISDLSDYSFQAFLKNKGLKFIVTQVFPNIKTSNLEIVKNFKTEMEESGFPVGSYTLEGFIDASIFVDVIKRINGEIGKEKILEIIEGMKNYNLEGLDLTFDPQTRSLNNQIWLDIGTDEWIEWPIS